jgi:hypothetical protein
MNRWISVRALCAAAFGLAFTLSAAHAADLWKAPPAPPAPSSLDIHGFFDLTKGGFQYYHIFNDALLAAQELTGSAGSFPPAPGTGGYGLGNYPDAHRNVVLGFAGTGFSF